MAAKPDLILSGTQRKHKKRARTHLFIKQPLTTHTQQQDEDSKAIKLIGGQKLEVRRPSALGGEYHRQLVGGLEEGDKRGGGMAGAANNDGDRDRNDGDNGKVCFCVCVFVCVCVCVLE